MFSFRCRLCRPDPLMRFIAQTGKLAKASSPCWTGPFLPFVLYRVQSTICWTRAQTDARPDKMLLCGRDCVSVSTYLANTYREQVSQARTQTEGDPHPPYLRLMTRTAMTVMSGFSAMRPLLPCERKCNINAGPMNV